jgi:hypothetical protein
LYAVEATGLKSLFKPWRFNSPTAQLVASLLENTSLMAKVFSNKSFQLSIDSLGTVAWDPDDRDDEPHPLGMMEVRWGQFVEHLVCSPNSKGLTTPFKNAQPPAKIAQNQHKTNWAQSKSGFVPKINQKY